jgi:hypothetical protein
MNLMGMFGVKSHENRECTRDEEVMAITRHLVGT